MFMKMTSIIVLAGGLALAGASGVAAQTTDPKVYVDLNVGGQMHTVTIATSSTFSLYGETGASSTSQTVGRGLVFDGGAGYRVRRSLAIGVAVSMFTRSPAGDVSITLPDQFAFNAFSTVAASPKLTQTEVATHVKVAYVVRVNDKMDVVVSGGPSLVHVSKEIASVNVTNGTAQIEVATQTGTATGVHGSLDANYLFTPRMGAGIFVRYVLAQVALPAAPELKVGGLQAGFGLRVRF